MSGKIVKEDISGGGNVSRLIIFFIRKKLGLKKYEKFRFVNQKSKHDYYYFNGYNKLMKVMGCTGFVVYSNVSLNWLLDDDCKIVKVRK